MWCVVLCCRCKGREEGRMRGFGFGGINLSPGNLVRPRCLVPKLARASFTTNYIDKLKFALSNIHLALSEKMTYIFIIKLTMAVSKCKL